MSGLFIFGMVTLVLWSYFSDVFRGRKPNPKESDAVLSLFILVISPLASVLVLLSIFGPSPIQLNGVMTIILWGFGWWIFAKLSTFFSNKFSDDQNKT
ncbi:hypothetical protein [Glaciecola sp. KUL10]|uniref:hypothetical protein n=1 Tax=Glaciecola sp. (strain KUL10) TaxID=2161813 RepID=UPI000D783F89|nr:hypothetical protein [Glaciecola sp. KUL10]GBL03156.1 polyglycerol phosphate synthase [Glaciecola sp. KUL10]